LVKKKKYAEGDQMKFEIFLEAGSKYSGALFLRLSGVQLEVLDFLKGVANGGEQFSEGQGECKLRFELDC
jgi:hypothetical protein